MILLLKRNVFKTAIAIFFMLLVQVTAHSQTQYPEPFEEEEEVETESDVIADSDTTGQAPLDSTLLVMDFEEIITELPEELMLDQIQCMDMATTIPMTYNKTIKGFINYFTVRKRSFVTNMLRRQHLYFPMYEQYLKKHALPDELKYLSIVESALNPRAVSPARAAGPGGRGPATPPPRAAMPAAAPARSCADATASTRANRAPGNAPASRSPCWSPSHSRDARAHSPP